MRSRRCFRSMPTASTSAAIALGAPRCRLVGESAKWRIASDVSVTRAAAKSRKTAVFGFGDESSFRIASCIGASPVAYPRSPESSWQSAAS